MQYALLVYENEATAYPEGYESPAFQAILEAHNAFAGELVEVGAMRGGAGLKPVDTATTVRVAPSGRTVHDGPFAETREQLGGFYLIEAENLDDAIAWAKKLPIAPSGGSIEVRPVIDMPE